MNRDKATAVLFSAAVVTGFIVIYGIDDDGDWARRLARSVDRALYLSSAFVFLSFLRCSPAYFVWLLATYSVAGFLALFISYVLYLGSRAGLPPAFFAALANFADYALATAVLVIGLGIPIRYFRARIRER
ncbi:MAG: hypothetical protein R3256_05995 [Thalassovita sp.]|nr:hypothetical protein [Thalassovita sp.]